MSSLSENVEKALTLFEEELFPKFRTDPDRRIGAHGEHAKPEWQDVLQLLADSRLIVKTPSHAYTLGSAGRLVKMGAKTARGVIDEHLRSLNPVAPPFHSITQVVHPGGSAAMNLGSNSTVTSSVTNNVTTAMHELVDKVDALEESSDKLWEILRRLKKVELQVDKLESLKDVVDELEVERFVEGLGQSRRNEVLKILETAAPLIRTVLGVAG